ncbi:MAG: UvrD-helicase domain-containing protein [Candidatus Saccharibacteria bacterium]|nr:UvrD-helicase domain-containing protein [Candidatus Saccharibacteria bacterium]
MDVFEGLNEPQKEAVATLSGPLLVLAGAGSGKTKTLTHRIANLVLHGVPQRNILAVTFTNKAAKEMRGRLWNLLQKASSENELVEKANLDSSLMRDLDNDGFSDPPRDFMPYMGTFHGICVKILRIEAHAAGLSKNFVIYDSDDQLSLIKRAMKELKLTDKKIKPRNVQAVISSSKNEGISPEELEETAKYPNQIDSARIYKRYEKMKRASDALDFDDLLLETVKLFEKNLEVREKWQKKFHHVLIDEYQDTNRIQYRLVRALVGAERNICVVGDDWQSIYSWRGADFTNILNFEGDFPGAKVIKLEQNYRSTGNILNASQKVITANEKRTDKTLFTEAGDGEPVDIEALRDENAEAEFVALSIVQELAKNDRTFSDFAVLYRTNAQSYTFEKAFLAHSIPYKIVGGVRFYDRREVKDVLAILRLIVNPNDRVSLTRVVQNVLSGVGASSLEKMFRYVDLNEDATLMSEATLSVLPNRGKVAMGKLQEIIYSLSQELPPAEIVQRVIEDFNFEATLKTELGGEERLENLAMMVGNAEEFETLSDFLAEASLMSSADESSEANSVTLMTIHAAKGLEFPVVYLVGMEEGLFPMLREFDQAEVEEERRLAYVGMTRAMEHLFLTFAKERFLRGQRSYAEPSRFLREIGYKPYGVNDYYAEVEEYFDSFPDDDLPVYE